MSKIYRPRLRGLVAGAIMRALSVTGGALAGTEEDGPLDHDGAK